MLSTEDWSPVLKEENVKYDLKAVCHFTPCTRYPSFKFTKGSRKDPSGRKLWEMGWLCLVSNLKDEDPAAGLPYIDTTYLPCSAVPGSFFGNILSSAYVISRNTCWLAQIQRRKTCAHVNCMFCSMMGARALCRQ